MEYLCYIYGIYPWNISMEYSQAISTEPQVMVIPEPEEVLLGEVVQFNPSAGRGWGWALGLVRPPRDWWLSWSNSDETCNLRVHMFRKTYAWGEWLWRMMFLQPHLGYLWIEITNWQMFVGRVETIWDNSVDKEEVHSKLGLWWRWLIRCGYDWYGACGGVERTWTQLSSQLLRT